MLCLLPEVPRDVIFIEALTIEHEHLEEVLDTEAQLATLDLKSAFTTVFAGPTSDSNHVLGDLSLLDALGQFHLVLGEGLAFFAN